MDAIRKKNNINYQNGVTLVGWIIKTFMISKSKIDFSFSKILQKTKAQSQILTLLAEAVKKTKGKKNWAKIGPQFCACHFKILLNFKMQNTEHSVCPYIHQAKGEIKNRYLRNMDTKNPVCALPYSVTHNHMTVDSPCTRQNYVHLELAKICNNTFTHFNSFEVPKMQIYP